MRPPLFQRSSRFGYRRWRRSGWLLVHLAPDTPHKARDGCDPACRRSSTSRDSRKVCCAAADLSGSHATGILCSKYTCSRSSLRAPRHGACCRRAWRAGSRVRHAPIHRRSGHSDIAICCGRNVRGSSPSTSVVPLSNQVTTLNHKRFKRFKMFSDGHSERLGQPFVVENRPGAGGTVADQAAVSAPHDGYTLVLGGLNQAINVTLYDKLSFIRDLAPVAGMIRTPLAMEVNPAFPAKTVPEFIAYAKANPGKINVASGGNGTPSHMSGELFKMMTGLNMVHVPYRGTALALTDLLGGQVQVVFDAVPSSVGHIRANRLRALAVTTAVRSDALPEIPIMGDFVPGYEASTWLGLSAPKNTPPEIIDKLNREINAGLADPKIKARLAEQGGTAIAGSATDYRKLFADETEKWGKVVKFANVKPE